MKDVAGKKAILLILLLWALSCAACEAAAERSIEQEVNQPSTSAKGPANDERSDALGGSATGSADRGRDGIEADLVFTGGTLVDGTGGRPLADAAVAVRDGRIVAVGKADKVTVADGARTLDVSGKTVLPGFINAHVHSRYVGLEETRAWTRAGVTTVRDLGGPLEEMVGRKRDSEASGDPRLPGLLVSGPMISVPGGHPFAIYGDDYPALAVRGPDDARTQVDRLLDAGVDHIKFAVSGRTETGWPELSDEEIQAIADTAHARGARVSAHVDAAAGLRRAVENGIDDAAHSPRDTIPDDLIREMVERDVALIPTIDVYQNIAEEGGTVAAWNAATLPVVQDNLRRFVAAGGTVALGDDFGNPGVEIGMPMDEIEQWTAAGLDPMRIIVAGTRDAAKVSGVEKELGTVERGKTADLLVVSGDPLKDPRSLERVELVVHEGRLAFRR